MIAQASDIHEGGNLAVLPRALDPLIAERRWLVWRWGTNTQGKRTKVPYRAAQPGVKASSTDPATWSDHATASGAVEAGEADGIGFALHESDFAAFDIDDCRDPDTGAIKPWAQDLIDEAGSYAEVTVSGTGVRIIGHAEGGHVHRNQPYPGMDGRVETYRRASRYIVVTGAELNWSGLNNIDRVIDETVARLDAGKKGAKSDGRAGANGEVNGRSGGTNTFREASLPAKLLELVIHGAPVGQRSEQFHHTVGWLKQLGWSLDDTTALLNRYPAGIAEKFVSRSDLEKEIERSYDKTDEPKSNSEHSTHQEPEPVPLRWHGDADPNADRAWLVRDLIPENGKGLLAGQWGTGKTFGALDLSASIMTGQPFAGRRVTRQGGVLFVAAEGAYEIPIRLEGLVKGKLAGLDFSQHAYQSKPVDPKRLPIAWAEDCPVLLGKAGLETLVATGKAAAARLEAEFGLPLALIIIDTVAASAGYDKGENDAAEGHRVMQVLERLSRETGAFVLGVDHFGKVAETGTRGSSAKESAADVVLAMLGDRDVAGNVSNLRMALRKLRGGRSGMETPYTLPVVALGENRDGEPITTCIVEWQLSRDGKAEAPTKAQRWPPSLRIFRRALDVVLIEHGKPMTPFGGEGPTVKAVPQARVKAEFVASYPAEGEDEAKRADAKRNAFNRALKAGLERGLITARDINGVDHIWLVHDEEDED